MPLAKSPSDSGISRAVRRPAEPGTEAPQRPLESVPPIAPSSPPPKPPKPQTSRLSVDLIVSDYAWLTEFARGADVGLSDVVRELLSQCRHDEDLAGRVRMAIWRAQGRI